MNVEITQDIIDQATQEFESSPEAQVFGMMGMRDNIIEIMSFGVWLDRSLRANTQRQVTDQEIADAQFAFGQWCVSARTTKERTELAAKMYAEVLDGTADKPGPELAQKIFDQDSKQE